MTLTILLCCLRDRLEDALLRDRIHSLVKSPNGGRVSPRAETVAFLWTLVQLPEATLLSPGTDGTELARDQRNILDIRQWFVDALSPERISEGQRVALARLILDHCYVARLIVRDRRKAPDIFIRINTRGKTLLRTDRLKAHLVAKAAAAEQMTLAARWDAAKELVGDDFDGEVGEPQIPDELSPRRLQWRVATSRNSIRRLIDRHGRRTGFLLDDPGADGAGVHRQILSKEYPMAQTTRRRFVPICATLSWLPRRQWVAPTLVWMVANRGRPMPSSSSFCKAMDRYAYGLLILARLGLKTEGERYDTVLAELRGAATDGATWQIVFAFTAADTRQHPQRAKFSIGNDNNLKGGKAGPSAHPRARGAQDAT